MLSTRLINIYNFYRKCFLIFNVELNGKLKCVNLRFVNCELLIAAVGRSSKFNESEEFVET